MNQVNNPIGRKTNTCCLVIGHLLIAPFSIPLIYLQFTKRHLNCPLKKVHFIRFHQIDIDLCKTV